MMGRNYDGMMGRHGDGEKKIILPRVPDSPILRVTELSFGGLA